jgi:hypothetical protein
MENIVKELREFAAMKCYCRPEDICLKCGSLAGIIEEHALDFANVIEDWAMGHGRIGGEGETSSLAERLGVWEMLKGRYNRTTKTWVYPR